LASAVFGVIEMEGAPLKGAEIVKAIIGLPEVGERWVFLETTMPSKINSAR
jgi:hypothetical protein